MKKINSSLFWILDLLVCIIGLHFDELSHTNSFYSTFFFCSAVLIIKCDKNERKKAISFFIRSPSFEPNESKKNDHCWIIGVSVKACHVCQVCQNSKENLKIACQGFKPWNITCTCLRCTRAQIKELARIEEPLQDNKLLEMSEALQRLFVSLQLLLIKHREHRTAPTILIIEGVKKKFNSIAPPC